MSYIQNTRRKQTSELGNTWQTGKQKPTILKQWLCVCKCARVWEYCVCALLLVKIVAPSMDVLLPHLNKRIKSTEIERKKQDPVSFRRVRSFVLVKHLLFVFSLFVRAQSNCFFVFFLLFWRRGTERLVSAQVPWNLITHKYHESKLFNWLFYSRCCCWLPILLSLCTAPLALECGS